MDVPALEGPLDLIEGDAVLVPVVELHVPGLCAAHEPWLLAVTIEHRMIGHAPPVENAGGPGLSAGLEVQRCRSGAVPARARQRTAPARCVRARRLRGFRVSFIAEISWKRMRRSRSWYVALGAAVLVTGCASVWGFDDLTGSTPDGPDAQGEPSATPDGVAPGEDADDGGGEVAPEDSGPVDAGPGTLREAGDGAHDAPADAPADAPVDAPADAPRDAPSGADAAPLDAAGSDSAVFDCTVAGSCASTVTCPAGIPCNVTCGSGGCGAIDCSAASACTVSCATTSSCGAVTCGGSSCDVTCGTKSCTGPVVCNSPKCTVTCVGAQSCGGGITTGPGTSTITCTGAGTCAGKTRCSGASCGLTCAGGGACSGGYCCSAGSCSTPGSDQCP